MVGREHSTRRAPVAAREFEIFLRVHFHVVARRVGVCHGDAGFDHFLEEEDQVGLLEDGRFAKRFAGEVPPRAMKMLAQTSPRRRE